MLGDRTLSSVAKSDQALPGLKEEEEECVIGAARVSLNCLERIVLAAVSERECRRCIAAVSRLCKIDIVRVLPSWQIAEFNGISIEPASFLV